MSTGVYFLIRRLTFFGAFASVALICFGIWNLVIGFRSSRTPQTLSCDTLIKDGYGNNAHVVVTDFVFRRPFCEIHVGDRTRTWAVAHAKGTGGNFVKVKNPIIVGSSDPISPADFERLEQQGQFQGVVTGRLEPSNRAAAFIRSELSVDSRECLYLDLGMRPKSMVFAFGMVIAGVVLCAIDIVIWAIAMRSWSLAHPGRRAAAI